MGKYIQQIPGNIKKWTTEDHTIYDTKTGD